MGLIFPFLDVIYTAKLVDEEGYLCVRKLDEYAQSRAKRYRSPGGRPAPIPRVYGSTGQDIRLTEQLTSMFNPSTGYPRRLITEMNDEQRELGPTVIIADHQDEGQGRGDRRWRQAEHGMYLNWLRSGIDQQKIALLPILAAAAARRALAGVGVANTRIKWPNDIFLNAKKVAGILLESKTYDYGGDTNHGTGIAVEGANNRIFNNTALENGTFDLADDGTNNRWWNNEFETANWE